MWEVEPRRKMVEAERNGRLPVRTWGREDALGEDERTTQRETKREEPGVLRKNIA